MIWTDAVLNAQADDDAARCVFMSLHTDDPGSTGADEASGGSPAYARQALAFEPGGDEGPLGVSQPATVGVAWAEASFDLPAGDFTHYGMWSAVSGGVFLGGDVLPVTVSLGAQGVQQVSVAVGPEA